jgi:hypothetical protein
MVTLMGLASFIMCNVVAISLRVWALTRGGKRFYEEGTSTPLHLFAERAILTKVFDEMSRGLDINHLDEENQTPIYIATVKGHHNIVEAMLKAGADPNLGCGYGRWTCLHSAKEMIILELLLHHGADPTLQDAWGKTAEDTQREEAEVPPVVEKGKKQTQADRDRYHLMRVAMAELIADHSARRTCDFFWRKCCPGRRTKRVTPYGKKLLEAPKRPGMISSDADKIDILRFFFKKHGTIIQVQHVAETLEDMLTGDDEVENFIIFEAYCERMEKTYGANPIAAYRAHKREERLRERDGGGLEEPEPRRRRFVPGALTKGMLRSKSYMVAREAGEADGRKSKSFAEKAPAAKTPKELEAEEADARARALRERLRVRSQSYRQTRQLEAAIDELEAELDEDAQLVHEYLAEGDAAHVVPTAAVAAAFVEEEQAAARVRRLRSRSMVSALKAEAVAAGVGESHIAGTMDTGNPKAALIELLERHDAGTLRRSVVTAGGEELVQLAAAGVAPGPLGAKSFGLGRMAGRMEGLRSAQAVKSADVEGEGGGGGGGGGGLRSKSVRFPTAVALLDEALPGVSEPMRSRSERAARPDDGYGENPPVSFRIKVKDVVTEGGVVKSMSFRTKSFKAGGGGLGGGASGSFKKKARSSSNRAVVPDGAK